MPKTLITLSIDDSLKDGLDRLKEQKNQTMTSLVVSALYNTYPELAIEKTGLIAFLKRNGVNKKWLSTHCNRSLACIDNWCQNSSLIPIKTIKNLREEGYDTIDLE